MKVKLFVSRSGIHPSGVEFSQTAGQTIEVDRKTGLRMIDEGQCEFLELSPAEIEEDKKAAAEAEKAEKKTKTAEAK